MVYDNAREADVETPARGLETRLTAHEGRVPSLTVTNPKAAALTENVMAGDGSLWWSWAERIAAVTDVAAAADAITRVLAAGPGGGRP
jgi:hypothetical protein